MTLHDWVLLAVAIAGIVSPGLKSILAALSKGKAPGK